METPSEKPSLNVANFDAHLMTSPEYYLKLMQHKLEAKLQIFTVFILRN